MSKNNRYVAFIRNIMIGRDGLSRDILIQIFLRLGCCDVKSYLATGNITFTYQENELNDLGALIEREIEHIILRKEDVFIRTVNELVEIKSNNYFSECSFSGIYEYCITFFKDNYNGSITLPFFTTRGDVELFRITDHEAYSVTKLIGGRTGSIGTVIEKKLNTKATTRNWNTIERILSDLNTR